MAELNLIDFYRDAALSLLHLQQTFPRRIELYVEDIIGPDHVDEFGLHSKRHEACLGALIWLAEEGFLRYATLVRQDAIDQAVLTAKALTLLNTAIDSEPTAVPDNGMASDFERNERRTLSAHVRRALDNGSSEQLVRVMRILLETRGSR